jgi:hypothetical protein
METTWKWVIKISTWVFFVCLSIKAVSFIETIDIWEIYDTIISIIILFALALAVTLSHSYGLDIDYNKNDKLIKLALKTDAMNIHAHFSWTIITVCMTIIPLYCSTAVVFISTKPEHNGQIGHILLYSILSIALSLSIYIIKPNERAKYFMNEFVVLRKLLLKYMDIENPSNEDKDIIIAAINQPHSMFSDI